MIGSELLTVYEVAAQAKVHPETIRRWIKGGRLPASQPGGGPYRIHATDFERIMAQRLQGGTSTNGGQPAAQ